MRERGNAANELIGLRTIIGQMIDEDLSAWLAEIVGDHKDNQANLTRKEALLLQLQRDRAVVRKLMEFYEMSA